MNDTPAVGVSKRLVDSDEAGQQLPQFQPMLAAVALRSLVVTADGVVQRFALDEAHGIKGTTIGVIAGGVNRHNAGMFEAAGDLGLAEKTVATLRIARVQRL